jgi:hypothetical protein
MKRFLDGLIFGAGFGLAFLVIAYIGFSLIIVPGMIENQGFESSRTVNEPDQYAPSEATAIPSNDERELLPFSDLGMEDQIEHASVIALAEFQPAADGKMLAVITDILKKEDGVIFYYQVGDELVGSSYYPRDKVLHGDGLVAFFTGSPASMRMSMTYHGERIGGLGDMPLKLFRERCESAGT